MSSHAHGTDPVEAACRAADVDDRYEWAAITLTVAVVTAAGLAAAAAVGVVVARVGWPASAAVTVAAAALAGLVWCAVGLAGGAVWRAGPPRPPRPARPLCELGCGRPAELTSWVTRWEPVCTPCAVDLARAFETAGNDPVELRPL